LNLQLIDMKKSKNTSNQEKLRKQRKSIIPEKISASEVHYRRLFESAKDGILILDAETGKIVDVNPYLVDLLGYSKNEFIEKSIWEIGAFQDIIENKEKFLELQQMEYVRYEDLPLETSDGSKINVEFVSNVYLVNSDKVIQCQIRDITERKETEAILEKTRNELAEIKKSADELNKFTENVIDTVREPLLAIDEDLRVIKASRSFYKFFKVTPEETIGKLIYELGNHQWDIPKLRELLEKIIPEKNSFDNYEVEHLFSTIGKRVMHLNARQVKRAFGKEKIILLAIEDITERKGKEDSLKETHRATSDFINILLNHMHAPIIIWDASYVIKRFNHKFEQLSGYNSAEVIDERIDFLFPKEKVATTLELLKNQLDDEHDVIEIDILTKDNTIKTVLWNSSRILDEEGKNIIATISQDITSRKLTEDALSLSETRYRRLFESAKDGILIIDAETGKIVDVNPLLLDLLGYSKKEFIEKSIWEIDTFQDIFENKEKFLELQQKEYVRYDDLLLATSDGREIYVEFVSNVYLANNFKVIQCNIRDNTEAWKIKKQGVESEEKFKTITDHSPDAIFITDKEGKYVYVNKQAIDLLGYSKDELLSFTIADISPKDRIEEYFQIFQQLLTTGSSYSEIELVKKDGSYADADLNAVLLPNGWIYGSCRDISERKKLENELITAKEKAEESDRLKTAFLNNISHEIRTPMNAIVGFSRLLNDPDMMPEKGNQYTDIIIQSSDQLLAIIDDIISIASIEAGQEEIRENEININTICKLIKEQFSPKTNDRNVTLSLKSTLPDDDATIITDVTKLTQIITNLVGNALKFTQQGSVNFGYQVKDNQLEFFVEDSGIGIPMDMHEIIFNRFRQLETTTARNFGGSGLGLSISKAYVELLGGKIWLTSELGKGAVFYFTKVSLFIIYCISVC
jgi:PAS domain S-box-containing protein